MVSIKIGKSRDSFTIMIVAVTFIAFYSTLSTSTPILNPINLWSFQKQNLNQSLKNSQERSYPGEYSSRNEVDMKLSRLQQAGISIDEIQNRADYLNMRKKSLDSGGSSYDSNRDAHCCKTALAFYLSLTAFVVLILIVLVSSYYFRWLDPCWSAL